MANVSSSQSQIGRCRGTELASVGVPDDGTQLTTERAIKSPHVIFLPMFGSWKMSARPPEKLNELIEALRKAGDGHKNEVLSKIKASLEHESDRGCVIFGAALIDESLEHLLRAHFRQAPDDAKLINSLFRGYAPLATFSAKLQLAYAFGIVSRQLQQMIELVRRLRNEFAHESGPLTFRDQRCADRLELLFKLSLERPSFKKVVDEHKPVQSSCEKAEANADSRRALFILVLTFLLGFLSALTDARKAGLDARE